MSNDLIQLPKINQLVERYRGMAESDWNRAFANAMAMQAQGLFEAAALIRAREEDGVDMEEIKERHREIFDIARAFAYGKAVPSLARFWPDRRLIKLLSNLPFPDQERIAADMAFPVVVLDSNGEFTHLMRTASRMLPAERQLVFGAGSIRSEQEQRDILMARRTRTLRQAPPDRVGIGKMDYDRVGVIVGNQFVPLASLEEMVRVLRRFGHRS